MSIRADIDFALTYTKEIELAIEEKRLDPNRPKSGGGNGHCRISDPTAMQGIFNAMDLDCVEVFFGGKICGRQRSRIVRRPESWVAMAKDIKKYYADTLQGKIIDMKFREIEMMRKEICAELNIGYTYYNQIIVEIYSFAYGYMLGKKMFPKRA